MSCSSSPLTEKIQYIKAPKPSLHAIWAAKGQVLYSIPPELEKDDFQAVSQILSSLAELNISFIPWPEFQRTRIKKLLMNATVNPLTALLRVRNGTLLRSEDTKSLARSIIREATRVFAAESPDVMEAEGMSAEDLSEEMLRNLIPMGGNISSMCGDILAERTTEM